MIKSLKKFFIHSVIIFVGLQVSVCGYSQELADTTGYDKIRIGGNGEIVGNFRNKNENSVFISGFALGVDFKFTPEWILTSEVDYADGVGFTLDKLHVTRLVIPALNFRLGKQQLPVGLLNVADDPIEYFGTQAPEGESALMPCPWNEIAFNIFGNFGKGLAEFDYQAMVVADRDGTENTDKHVHGGWLARLDWIGVPGLDVGLSFYTRKQLYAWDYQYENDYITTRGSILHGHKVRSLNYDAEIGFNFGNVFKIEKSPVIYPFVRYEYYDSKQPLEIDEEFTERLSTGPVNFHKSVPNVSKWSVGLNWFPLPELVVKADYAMCRLGTQKLFGSGPDGHIDTFAVSIGYAGDFFAR